MSGKGSPDTASHPEHGPERAEKAAPSPPRRRWLRDVLAIVGGVVAVVFAVAVWIALDPGVLRPAAEYIVTAATGRSVAIGAIDFRLAEGRAVVEVRKVRVGQTTTERVNISLVGMRARVNGDGVRFPNGSSIDHFLASIDLSLTGRPRISTVDATGAVLVARRRPRSDSTGPPPLARLLVVPRILLGLGLERLVLRSGELEYHGLSSTWSAGMTAVLDATDEGLAFRGELLVGPGIPPLPFAGTVRDPMADDWRIDVRITGDQVPMAGVRFLAGVLEPGPTLRTTLRKLSSRARFLLSIGIARARIEASTLDFTFSAPGESDAAGISLEGVRFLAHTVPDPGGWSVTGEVDWSRLPGGKEAEPSPFAMRWTTGVPGSFRWSTRRVAVPLLAGVAGNTLPPGHALRPALERLELTGMINELAAFGNPGADDGETSFWLSALLSGFGATAGAWRISDAGARVEFAEGGWRVRFVDDRLHAGIPSFRSSPYELTLRGDVQVSDTETGWTAHTSGLGFVVAGLAGRIEGSLRVPRADSEAVPLLDSEIRLDEVALADIGTLLPDQRAVAFTRWYRRAVRSGRLTESTIRVRGDPRGIPFPEGGGEFEAQGTVRDVDFVYAENWPAVRIGEAGMRANGATLEFSAIKGSIFDTSIEDGFARLPDATRPAGRVRVSLAGSGPARDLLKFVRASPLATETGGPAPDLRADGPTSTMADLDVPYGRGAGARRIDVAGKIELDGIAVSLAGRRAEFEEVRGDLTFDVESLSGGPLAGRFRGAEIESHVDFDRDEGLLLRFSGEGGSEWFGVALDDLVALGHEETDPWLKHVHGPVSWDAEYRSRAGIVFRSDLRTASVAFPPPFGKAPGTARRLEVALTPGETEWVVAADYGPNTKGVFEIAETGGAWGLARGAIRLGGAPPVLPALPAQGRVEVSGELAELDLDPWLALAVAGSAEPAGWLSRIGRIALDTGGARVLDQGIALARLELTTVADRSEFHVRLAGKGVEGEIVYPVDPAAGRARIRLARVHFEEPLTPEEDGEDDPSDDGAGNEGRPDRWPSFDARIDSLRFAKLDLGAVRATGNRMEDGLEIEELKVDSPGLRMRGSGSWFTGEDDIPTSRLKARLKTGDLARLLAAAGLDDETAEGGTVEISFDLAWPGSPLEPSLAQSVGTIRMDAKDGSLPRVRVGPLGRLFALLSLEALPRVLALDLSHVVGKGFAYDRITARTKIGDGSANIREFTIDGPSAQIAVSGRIDLVARRYDQEIAVIPRLTRSGALLPAWVAAWPFLAANFLLEKAGDKILLDRLFRFRYRLHGPLDDPEIERVRPFSAKK